MALKKNDSPLDSLSQLNVRLPAADCDELRRLAGEGGVSVNALLGAIVHTFFDEHDRHIPAGVLKQARSIDSMRRRRPHLRRRRV